MFRKLRLKFIGIASGSMLIVLFIVLGLVNFISYRNVVSDIYVTLEFLSENTDAYVNTGKIKKFKGKDITPETQFESRYVVVEADGEGDIISFNIEHITAIEDTEIPELYTMVAGFDDDRGIFTYNSLTYAYLKKTRSNGNIEYTVMDCTRNMQLVNFFTKFSLYVGVVSILLLMLLVSIFARKAVRPMVKNIEAQKQFITNASHELKTPLAVISANTEVMEMMNGKNEWTESTINQVNRMTDLISQLVVLSRLEERADIVLTDVDMTGEVEEVTGYFKSVVDTQGKKLITDITSGIHVKADQKGLHELISILMDNAVKYCDDGGTISVKLTHKGRNASLVVSNDYSDGEGVDYKRFFDRFYREDQSHNNETKGYGIGLSMADSLVRMFKGKISVSYKKPIISFTVIL